jgi:hypothetical protein
VIPVAETDHATGAPNLFTDMFRGRPRLEAILVALTRPFVALETAAWDVILKRTLDASTYEQLDVIGRVVGEQRKGRTDAQYRAILRLVIRARRSQGRTTDVLDVLTLSGFDFSYREHFPAGFRAEVFSITNGPDLAFWVFVAKALGAAATVAYSPTSRATTWGVDSSGTAGVTGNVYASTTDRTLGFGLASCRSA